MDVVNVTAQFKSMPEAPINWAEAIWNVRVVAFIIAIVGLIGNLLTYISADLMPASNQKILMQLLAVWDCMGCVLLGVVNQGLQVLFNLIIVNFNVSNSNQISDKRLELALLLYLSNYPAKCGHGSPSEATGSPTTTWSS